MIYLIADLKNQICKIGHSSNPKKRLSQLRVGYPHKLLLIGVAEGGLEEESIVHSKLSDCRLTGEWFKLNDSILRGFGVEDAMLLPKATHAVLASAKSSWKSLRLAYWLASKSTYGTNAVDIANLGSDAPISLRRLRDHIQNLKNDNLLTSFTRGQVMINPEFLWKGPAEYWKDACKEYATWKTVMK